MSAAPTDRGGALFVPPSNPRNRIANGGLYTELYLSDRAEGAIAETFGRFDVWTEERFLHPRGRYALALFEVEDFLVCDLDDASTLVRLNLKPTDVVTRNRAVTQAWSRLIFSEGKWDGVSWWSYYFPEWASVAFWNVAKLRLGEVRELSVTSSEVRAAADVITRLVLL